MAKLDFRRLYILKDFILDTRHFGLRVSSSALKLRLPHFLRDSKRFEAKWIDERHNTVESYLALKYRDIIQKFENPERSPSLDTESPIWMFWWQGEENAPPIVQACINSVRLRAEGRRFIVVSKANYRDYVTIPRRIEDKFHQGIISTTHLSEVVRFMLLAEYGGLWLDATVFCVDRIPNDVFTARLFSCR